MSERLPWPLRACVAAAIVLLVALRILDFTPPGVVGAAAPPEAFSAERARRHIEALATEPRPVGSAAHDRARDAIRAELAALGLEVDLQSTTVVGTWWGAPYDVARAENVVARIRGTDPSGAVLLIAHYDSVPHSPGAGDDASGVAVLLETARALLAAGRPRNDVILLFSDAEEAGALGAQGFHRDHPWSRDVRVALNFDSRGTGGAAALFDTSDGNRRLIEELSSAVPRPLASSLFNEVARRMGHATDLKVFKAAGIPSMNFAFTDDAVNYHTPRDALGVLDLRSVQHLGTYALPLSRRFAASDLRLPPGEELIYFDIGRGRLLSYSRSFALPLAALLLLAYLVLARAARRAGAASIRGIAAGALGALGMVAAGAAAAGLPLAALRRALPALGAMRGDPYDAGWYRLGLSLLAVAAAAGVFTVLRRKLREHEVLLGVLAPWCAALLAVTLAAPGASHYFAWPLAGALASLALAQWSKARRPAILAAGANLGALPAIALAVPGPYLLFVALQLPRGAIAAALSAFVATLLLPHVLPPGGRSLRPAAILGLAGAAVLGVAAARAEFSAAEPRPIGLSYALDASSRRAAWITTDAMLPAAHEPYFKVPAAPVPAVNPYDADRITRRGEAPPLEIQPPSAVLLGDELEGQVQRRRIRVSSSRAAPELFVLVEEGAVLRAVIDGRAHEEAEPFRATPERPWGIRYLGPRPEGFELVLEMEAGAPLALRLIDRSYELPSDLAPAPMPDLMPVPFYLAGSTFVGQQIRF